MDFVQEAARRRPRGAQKKKKSARLAIHRDTATQLWQAAGALCSFPNCCEPVDWNTLTFSRANYSNVAHIVSWTENGPRGKDPLPPEMRNHLSNLMLVCRRCHKEIDDDMLLRENAKLKFELKEFTEGRIHTCHDECQRIACVFRRENESLRAEIDKIKRFLAGEIVELEFRSTGYSAVTTPRDEREKK